MLFFVGLITVVLCLGAMILTSLWVNSLTPAALSNEESAVFQAVHMSFPELCPSNLSIKIDAPDSHRYWIGCSQGPTFPAFRLDATTCKMDNLSLTWASMMIRPYGAGALKFCPAQFTK